MKKIDMHVHSIMEKGITWPVTNESFTTPAELRQLYAKLGVDKGVLLPLVSPECRHYCISNEETMGIVDKYPDMFYWFCNIDPRMGGNSPDTDLSYFISYYKKLGARGVGEVTANMFFDDPLVLNLFSHCEKCNMPLIFHIGNKGKDYGLVDDLGLPRLEKALSMFPKLQFLGHSQKFWAEIGPDATEQSRSGYPQGKVLPGGRVVELMRKYPNLSGDLSARSGCNAVMRDPDFGCRFIEEFQDRLYYGIDYCGPVDNESPMLKLSSWLDECVQAGKISQTAYRKVCRENAVRLLEADS